MGCRVSSELLCRRADLGWSIHTHPPVPIFLPFPRQPHGGSSRTLFRKSNGPSCDLHRTNRIRLLVAVALSDPFQRAEAMSAWMVGPELRRVSVSAVAVELFAAAKALSKLRLDHPRQQR